MQKLAWRHKVVAGLFIGIVLFLAGCGLKAADWVRPNDRLFSHMPSGGSAEYNQGWQDGCESGMTGHTNSFYQSFYRFKQDNKLLSNEVYYKSWTDANTYCRLYSYSLLRESDMRRTRPNEPYFLIPGKPKGVLNFLESWGPPITNRR
jgi:hypothetical protein